MRQWAGPLNEKSSAPNPEKTQAGVPAVTQAEIDKLTEKAFYPFTFPVTAGPGSIVVMLTLSVHASRGDLTSKLLSHVGLFLSAVVLSVLVYFCYAYAPRITRTISPATAHGILRVVAFILLCIGVQIAWNGFSQLIKTVLDRP